MDATARLRRMQHNATAVPANWDGYLTDYLNGVRAGDWRELNYGGLPQWRDASLGDGRVWRKEIRDAIIRALDGDGMSVTQIQEATGVSRATIQLAKDSVPRTKSGRTARQQGALGNRNALRKFAKE